MSSIIIPKHCFWLSNHTRGKEVKRTRYSFLWKDFNTFITRSNIFHLLLFCFRSMAWYNVTISEIWFDLILKRNNKEMIHASLVNLSLFLMIIVVTWCLVPAISEVLYLRWLQWEAMWIKLIVNGEWWKHWSMAWITSDATKVVNTLRAPMPSGLPISMYSVTCTSVRFYVTDQTFPDRKGCGESELEKRGRSLLVA